MKRALRNVRFAAVVAAVLFVLSVPAEPALAGQARTPASPIPGRVAKVKEGDWVLYRTGNELIKETATKIEDIRPDVKQGEEGWFEPVYMVEYTMEKFDGETGKPSGQPMNVVRALEHEIEENAELLKGVRAKPQQRKVNIDGKAVNVIVVTQAGENGAQIENWFTDAFGIDGRAGIIVKMPDADEPYQALEVASFGTAKQQANIAKYLRKK